MPSHLCLTIRFLQPYSHGRGEDGQPEWPPSPLRAFQALVAAAAARWNERLRVEYAAPALRGLEQQLSPTIVAATGVISDNPYLLYIPNNTADLLVSAWKSGDAGKVVKREQKPTRPTHLRGDAVHYLFPLPDGNCPHLEVLSAAARSITHLGWGVDMAAGTADVISDEVAAKLPGERWQPGSASAEGLRVPRDGTLSELAKKHEAFLGRLSGDGFKPVPPLSAFRVVGYRRATDPVGQAWAAFRILSADPDDGRNPSFDSALRCRDVAAWVRHAAARACAGWPFGDIAGFVCGHDSTGAPLKGEHGVERFMYLPLPTINHKLHRAESIRRVLVAAPAGFEERIEWIRRRLPGAELIREDHGTPAGLLNYLPTSDWVLRQYTGSSQVWTTVTPVILPRHDKNVSANTKALLRLAFQQTGYSPDLLQRTEIDWRKVGFRAGVDHASRYLPPKNLDHRPRYHVCVRFPVPIPGPVAIGAGRFRGFGLMAVCD